MPHLACPAATPRSDRNDRVLAHLALVDPYVRRYAMRGVPKDDLRQVAYLALVQAAERFDPDRGQSFEAFAAVTIAGTLKRYFRDRTWTVRPPRALLEVHLDVRRADEVLSQRLGRRPTVTELAEEVGVDVDRIHEALEASSAHTGVSLEAPPEASTQTAGAGAWLAEIDPGFGASEARSDLRRALAELDEHDLEIIRLRYEENLTQAELGERLGVSQSYASRVVRSVLVRLRASMEADPDLVTER